LDSSFNLLGTNIKKDELILLLKKIIGEDSGQEVINW
jgi:hypothetical protein